MDKKIFEMILNSGTPVSNRDLALNCKISINTVRKEINLLNEQLSQYGIVIVSQPSIGNYIEIIDSTLAMGYLNRFRELYKRNKRMKNTYSPNIHYLLRKYLSASQPFTIDSLCQELYCSKGTLLKDIEIVKDILNQFDLKLHNRNRGGLIVEGNEWNIRQCLVYQHKVYKNSFENERFNENEFKRLFLDQISNFNIEREALVECLNEQSDFTLPMIYYPKIIHYMQLSYTRKKYEKNMYFSNEQIQRAIHTPEYKTAKNLYQKFCSRLNIEVGEQDIIALTMLLLSYESQNFHLQELPQYKKYYDETLELCDILVSKYGCTSKVFNDQFIQEWICFLYTLENRLTFNVYVDQEIYEEVEKKGIRSTDFCLIFAQLYEKNHGIQLKHEETITAFYLFHTALKEENVCYYAQNILVISHYGISRAKSLALNIRLGYGKEVKLCTPIELGEKVDVEEYDLLLTDAQVSQFHYFKEYDLPIISIDFSFRYRCVALDEYLKKVRYQSELGIIQEKSFVNSNFRSKEDAFDAISKIKTYKFSQEQIKEHIQKNDSLIELERNHGIVCIPVLLEMDKQFIKIFVNDEPFIWNKNLVQVVVCYSRIKSINMNQILNNILERFVHIKRNHYEELLCSNGNYLETLYKEEDFDK